MRHLSLALASAALIAVGTPCVLAGQQASASRASALDSLSAQLVELELQRVSGADVVTPQVGPARDISSQIAALHERLRALPEGETADREASSRVLLALDARAASVQAQIHELRLIYLDAHPAVRQLLSQQRAIDQRRSEIRPGR